MGLGSFGFKNSNTEHKRVDGIQAHNAHPKNIDTQDNFLKYLFVVYGIKPYLTLARFRKFAIVSSIAILAFFTYIYGIPFVKANEAIFFPTSCLGGWKNVSNAEGKPDVDPYDVNGFNESNSAFIKGEISQIFCGSFKLQSELSPDVTIKRVKLKISWALKNPEIVTEQVSTGGGAVQSEEVATTTESITATTTDTVSASTEGTASTADSITSPSIVPVPETTPDKPSTEASSEQPVQSTETQPATEPAVTPEAEPQSEPVTSKIESFIFSYLFGEKVFAEDTLEQSTSTATTSVPEELIQAAIQNSSNTPESAVVEERDLVTQKPVLYKIRYTLDGEHWKELGDVTEDDIRDKIYDISIDDVKTQEELSRLQINIQSAEIVDSNSTVYLDGMSLTVEYDELSDKEIKELPRVEVDAKDVFDSDTDVDFSQAQDVEFEIQLDTATTTEATSTVSMISSFLSYITPKTFAAESVKKKVLLAEVTGPDGKLYSTDPVLEQGADGKVRIKVPRKKNNFRPGVYKLRVEVLSDEKVLVTTQEFSWGVLAVNTNKSSYLPDEDAYVQLSALSSSGHSLCNANLKVIIDGIGGTETYTTQDGSIKKTPTCTRNNVTDEPDFYFTYKTKTPGDYAITFQNLDNGFQVKDTLRVYSVSGYVVERTSATRINPFASTYTMNVKVKPRANFKGIVSEVVPAGFDISSSTPGMVQITEGDIKKLQWNVDIQEGDTFDFAYVYQAPMISPELYVVGPLSLIQNNVTAYTEERSWQIASDAVCNAIASGNWNDGSKWSGCSGAGGMPDATDDVTINSGVLMTVTADATVNSVVVAVNSSGTVANGININSGVTLTVTGNVTMNMPTALTSTVAVGSGTLSATNIFIPGSATSGRNASVTLTTGTLNVSDSIRFSGTATRAILSCSGACTINVGGTLGNGGTLTQASTSKVVFNGSGTQFIGAYTTYQKVDINTSGTVSSTSTVTIANGLTINSGTFNIGSTFTSSATTTVNGTLAFTASVGTKTFGGTVIVNSGGVWTNSVNSGVVMQRGLVFNGSSFTSGTAAYTFSGNAQSITSASSTLVLSFGSMTITGVTLTSDVDLTVTTALTGTGGLVMSANKTLNIGGTSTVTTFNVSATGVTVNYNGSSGQTARSTTYRNLRVNGTAVTLGGTISVDVLTIGDTLSTALLADNGFAITPTGASQLSVQNSGTLRLGNLTATTFPNFSNVSLSASSTVNYNASVLQTISSTPVYGNLTASAANAKTVNGDLTVMGNLTSSTANQTIILGGFNHSIYGNIVITSGTVQLASSTVSLYGNVSGSGILHSSTTTSTLYAVGTSTQTIGGPAVTLGNFVVSKSSGTVTMTTTWTTQTVTVDSGTLNLAAAVTVNGTTTVNDGSTLGITLSTGAKVFVGRVTLGSNSVWDNSINSAVTLRNGLTLGSDVTFTSGIGIYTFDTNHQVVTATSTDLSISNITVTGITLTSAPGSTLISGTAFTGTGAFTQGDSSYLKILGTSAITTLNATSTANTVEYAGVAQTIKPVAYYNLKLAGSGAKTATSLTTINNDFTLSGTASMATAAAIAVGGNVSIESGTTLTVAGFNFTVSGTTTVAGTLVHSSATGTKTYTGKVTVDTGGIWNNSGSSVIYFKNGLEFNGTTFTSGTGAYTFDTNDQSISGTSPLTISSVAITGVTLTNLNSSSTSITTALTGTGSLTQGTGSVLRIAASSITIPTLDASTNDNVVRYNGTTQTIFATTYDTLEVDSSTLGTLGGAISVNTLIIGQTSSSAVLADGGYTITPTGLSSLQVMNSGTLRLGASTATSFPLFDSITLSSSSTVNYAATAAQNISHVPTYGNVSFTGVSTKTAQGSLTITGDMTVNASGQFVDFGNFSGHTISGNLTVTAGTFNLNSSTVSVYGNISGSGTFNGTNSTLRMVGTNTQTLVNTSNLFNNIEINKAGGSVTASGTLNASGTLSVIEGLFNFAGTATITGQTNIASGGSVNFTVAAGTKDLVGKVNIASGGSWSNTINSAVTFRNGIEIASDAFFSAGTNTYTFNTNTQSITSASSTISIGTIAMGTGVNLINNTAGLISSSISGPTFTQAEGSVLKFSGSTFGVSTLNASSTNNTFEYSGPDVLVKDARYYNLILSGTGTSTLSVSIASSVDNDFVTRNTVIARVRRPMTVGGNLNIESGSAVTIDSVETNPDLTVNGTTTVDGRLNFVTSYLKTFNGPISIGSSGVWNNQSNAPVNIKSGLAHYGTTFTAGSGTYTFDTNNQSITGSSTISIPSITVNAITLTNESTAEIGVWQSFTGTGTWTQGENSILRISNINPTISGFNASATGNEVIYDADTDIPDIIAATYFNLTSTGALESNLKGNVTVLGDLNVGVQINPVSYTMVLKGDVYGLENIYNLSGNQFTLQISGSSDQVIESSNLNSNITPNLIITASSTRSVFLKGKFNVNNRLELVGVDGGLLSLLPSVPSTYWYLNLTGATSTQSVSYVYPSYSDASGGKTIVGTNITDGGNNLNWSSGSVSCSTETPSASLGTLTPGVVAVSIPTATTTVSCGGTGCSLFVKSTGNGVESGLYAPSVFGTPIIRSTTTTLTAGIDGYGIQANLASGGSDAPLTIESLYDKTGNNVGALSLSDVLLASSNALSTNRQVVVTHKASVSPSTLPGNYQDVVTYSCVAN